MACLLWLEDCSILVPQCHSSLSNWLNTFVYLAPIGQRTFLVLLVSLMTHSLSLSPPSSNISSTHAPKQEVPVTAIVLSKLICELPLHNVTLDSHWRHLSNLRLADPTFGEPGRVDLVLGVMSLSK